MNLFQYIIFKCLAGFELITLWMIKSSSPSKSNAFFSILHLFMILFYIPLLKIATNNTAEYQAIINALKTAERFHRGHLQVYSDSKLAVQQINKKWKINKPQLSKLCSDVYRLCEKYEKVEFFHVGLQLYFQKRQNTD